MSTRNEHDRDDSLARMTFAEFRENTEGLSGREARILASIDWHGLEPTELSWDMLRTALKPSLIAEQSRAKNAALARRGVTVEPLEGGCRMYRVAAWDRPTARPRRKPRR